MRLIAAIIFYVTVHKEEVGNYKNKSIVLRLRYSHNDDAMLVPNNIKIIY